MTTIGRIPSSLIHYWVTSVKANASEEPRGRLSDEEMKAQMQTLTLAGHETTASTVSWMLLELARHPEYQARLRAEIRARREVMEARGDIRFTVEDLDSLTLLNNAIKVLINCNS